MGGYISRVDGVSESKSLSINFKIGKYIKALHIKGVLSLLGQILNPKTVYFNFRYLPFSQAIKLPFYVSFRTRLLKTHGNVIISGPIKPGMIRIGFGEVGIFDKRKLRAILEIDGDIHFAGSALIKFGAKISVGKNASLYIGSDFRISPNSSIVCFHKIKIGNNVRISWETIMMDTDFHKIMTMEGKVINSPKPIIIGNNVWIGMGASIMKGTNIQDNIIVGAKSYLNRKIEESHCIIGGNPAKVVKTEVDWAP